MNNIIGKMMGLISNAVCGKAIDKEQYALPDDELERLYKLSKSHDLAHLVGDVLIKNDLITNNEIKAKFEKQILLAVVRYRKKKYELDRLCNLLNEAEIAFIPLKGSVIQQHYPEPWMRTSCDIDILVRDSQFEEATRLIIDKLDYVYEKDNYHDVSLKCGDVHLELHHNIKENMKSIDTLLSVCWDYATVREGYEYCFSNEYFIFHQVAHALYHFLHGGCGIRPFLDIYLLKKSCVYDVDKLNGMLSKVEAKRFFDIASRLTDVWLGCGEHDDVTRRMEHFIILGGVYGSTENSIAVMQNREKGRLGYILHRIWIPYELLCTSYPRLRGRRWLQPYYELKRLITILFDSEKRKRKTKTLNAIKDVDDDKKSEVNRMMNDLGLM